MSKTQKQQITDLISDDQSQTYLAKRQVEIDLEVKKMKTKKYTYFVSYSFPRGTGQTEIMRESPIANYDDVLSIRNQIMANNGLDSIIILNFILLCYK